jgi:WD40 repeat protein
MGSEKQRLGDVQSGRGGKRVVYKVAQLCLRRRGLAAAVVGGLLALSAGTYFGLKAYRGAVSTKQTNAVPLVPQPPTAPRSDAPPRTIAGHSGPVSSVAFSPDGKTLASGNRDSTVKLWEVGAGGELRSFSSPAERAQ